MEPAVLTGNTLKLPEKIAGRLRGKKIQVTEVEEGILLRPADRPIAEAKGFLKGKGFSSGEYLEMKKAEKELEH